MRTIKQLARQKQANLAPVAAPAPANANQQLLLSNLLAAGGAGLAGGALFRLLAKRSPTQTVMPQQSVGLLDQIPDPREKEKQANGQSLFNSAASYLPDFGSKPSATSLGMPMTAAVGGAGLYAGYRLLDMLKKKKKTTLNEAKQGYRDTVRNALTQSFSKRAENHDWEKIQANAEEIPAEKKAMWDLVGAIPGLNMVRDVGKGFGKDYWDYHEGLAHTGELGAGALGFHAAYKKQQEERKKRQQLLDNMKVKREIAQLKTPTL